MAYVRGLQSDDLSTGVVATGKHFVGYGASEGGLNWAPAHISARASCATSTLFPSRPPIRERGARHRHERLPRARRRAVRLLAGAADRPAARTSWASTAWWSPTTSRSPAAGYHHLVAADKGDAARLALGPGSTSSSRARLLRRSARTAIARGDVAVALVDRAVAGTCRQAPARSLRAAVRRRRASMSTHAHLNRPISPVRLPPTASCW